MPNTFTYIPTYGASEQTKPRVRAANFGDGYEQRVADGINTTKRVWTLTFSKSAADMATVVAFLANEGGLTAFTWTPPRGASGLWVCREWTSPVNDGYDTLNVTFEEVHE